VQFQLVIQSSGGGFINTHEESIGIFPASYPNGQCCGLDSQCTSGFCRGGASDNKVCCESDCGGGVCNSQSFGLGLCCGAEGFPACP
jgi:hypothetical protein